MQERVKSVCRSTGIGGMDFPVWTECVRATHGNPGDTPWRSRVPNHAETELVKS
jgi:hypothetical protein